MSTIRALIIEDNPSDIRLIKELVVGIPSVRFRWGSVERLSQATALMNRLGMKHRAELIAYAVRKRVVNSNDI